MNRLEYFFLTTRAECVGCVWFGVFIISIVLLLHTVFMPYRACAADVHVAPAADGAPIAVEGQLPVTKVGALLATDTLAILGGTTVAIVVHTSSGPHQVQVQGHLMNNNLTTNGRVGQINGKAYFDKGPSLKQLGEAKTEKLVTNDGHVYNGHVVSIDNQTVQFQQENGPVHNIAMHDVKDIQSQHTFRYQIHLKSDSKLDSKSSFSAHADKITFTQTQAPTTTTTTTTTTHKTGNFQKILVITTIALLVATAIAVPVAVGVASHNAHAHHVAQDNANRAVAAILVKRAQATQTKPNTPNTHQTHPTQQKFALPKVIGDRVIPPSLPSPVRILPSGVASQVPVRTTVTTTTTAAPIRSTYP